jgi:hypothetical protein
VPQEEVDLIPDNIREKLESSKIKFDAKQASLVLKYTKGAKMLKPGWT